METATTSKDAETRGGSLTIFKYPLEKSDTNYIQLHKGSRVLAFQDQGFTLCMWVYCDPSLEMELRRFRIYGTGWQMESLEQQPMRYIGTAQQGPMVWHLFELVDKNEGA